MRQSEVAPVDQLRADRQRRCPVNVGPVALAVCVGITLFGCTSTDSQPAASTQPAPADPTTAPKAAPGSLSSDTPAAGTPTVVVPESIPVPRPQVREVARPAITLTNLATQGTATQSSTYRAGVAARANDGVTDGDWYHNSVSHTEDQPNSFWQVQLASPTTISRIVLFNRDRFELRAVGEFPGVRPRSRRGSIRSGRCRTSQVEHEIRLPAGTARQIVRIQLKGQGILSLAEVQVVGVAASDTGSPR